MDWTSDNPEDWKKLRTPQFYVCNSTWLLDDFTRSNGPTRGVSGSHLRAQALKDVLDDPMQPEADEVLLTAPTGTVVVFNSHTGHGGIVNSS